MACQYGSAKQGRCTRAKGSGFSCVQRSGKRQTTRRDRRGIERQRTFPIGITRTPAPSSSGGFPTRVLPAPARTVAPGPASENLHRGGLPRGDRVMAGIYLWILRHHGLIRNPIMTSFHSVRRSDRGQIPVGSGSTSGPSDCPSPVLSGPPWSGSRPTSV